MNLIITLDVEGDCDVKSWEGTNTLSVLADWEKECISILKGVVGVSNEIAVGAGWEKHKWVSTEFWLGNRNSSNSLSPKWT